MKTGYDNIIAQLLVRSCQVGFGSFMAGQIDAILTSLIANLQNQLAQGAAEAVKIGPLHRGGSLLQASRKGGLGL